MRSLGVVALAALAVGLVGIIVSATVLFAADAQEVEIIAEGGAATNGGSPIDLTSYDTARTALTATNMVLEFPGASTLANTPLDSIDSIVADDDERAITMVGELDFEGSTVEAALVFDWPNNGGGEPTISLGLQASAGGLNVADLDPSMTLPGGSTVVLGAASAGNTVSAFLAFSTGPQDVSSISAAMDFYPDDIVLGGGMVVHGTLDLTSFIPEVGDGVVATMVGEIGAPVDLFNSPTAIEIDKLSMAGSVSADQMNLPGALTSSEWAIGIEYDVDADDLTLSAGADMTLSDPVLGDNDVELAASVETNGTTFTLSAGLAEDDRGLPTPWVEALGTNLTVTEFNINFDTDGAGASTATMVGAVQGGAASGNIGLTVTETSIDAQLTFAELSIASMASELAPAFGNAVVDVPPQLENLKLSAAINFSYDSVANRLEASALGSVGFGNDAQNTVSVLVLFSQVGNNAPTGFVSGSMDSIPLGDIIPGLGDDFANTKLPAVGLRVNDTAVNTAQYDGATQTYLQENFCDTATTNCNIPSGVALRGTFPVPESLKGPLKELWIDVDQPLVIEGTADVFSGSGSSFDLSITLPPMTPPDAQDWFVSANLSLSLSSDPNFTFKLSGDMTVKIADGDPPPGGTQQYDQVTFFIDTSLELNLAVPSVSLTVTGGLQGTWDSPAGVDWLRVTQFKIQIKVTVGAGKSAIVVGFRGGAQFCTTGDLNNCSSANLKDFDASIAIGVRTPGPGPCNCSIDVGFRIASKAGVSLGDIVTISEQAGDITIPQAVKDGLPEVAVKNIELMISTIDSPELCLTSGIRLTADLYIGDTSSGGVPDAADLVGQCRTVQEQLADGGARCEAVDECYASVMFEMTSAGLFVDASMKALDLGPIAVTGAGDAAGPRLSLVVTEDTQEFSISGGIKIDGMGKAEGSVMIGDGGFAFSLYVGDEAMENFFQIDASAQFGTDMDPDAIVFDLDMKLILDIQDIVDAIYNDLFGWTGANYLEFRCIRLLVTDLEINPAAGEIIPTSGTISVGIHVMIQDEDDDNNNGNTDELLPKKLGVDWDFGDNAGTNVTGIIGDVFGGFQIDDIGCGLPASVQPSVFELGTTPENLVARNLGGGNGYDLDPEVFVAGQTASIVARAAFPEPGILPEVYTLRVYWGDISGGSETVSEEIRTNVFNGLPRPSEIFAFDHQIALPPGVQSETRNVRFEITDQGGDIVFTASSPIKVIDGAPHDLFVTAENAGPTPRFFELDYNFRPSGSNQGNRMIVDWGDDNEETFVFPNSTSTAPFAGTISHAYTDPGEYGITAVVENTQNAKSVQTFTSVEVENADPRVIGFPVFKSSKDGVVTPIPAGGEGLYNLSPLAIPRGADLLISFDIEDLNFHDDPTRLTASMGADNVIDVPMTTICCSPAVDRVVDVPVDVSALQDQDYPQVAFTFSDKFGGSRTLELDVVFTPDNGLRADATSVSGVDIETESNTFRSPVEPGDPNQATNRGGAIWWEWTPTVSGTYRISDDGSRTVNGGDQETLITLYTAGLSQLSQAGQAGNGVTQLITTTVTAGTTYLIGVQPVSGVANPSVDPNGAGPVELAFALAGVPVNDDFGNAIPIPLVGGSFPHWNVDGTTVAATPQEIEPSHNGRPANTSVWYTWDSTYAAPFEITVAGDDPRVAVYELDGSIDPALFDHVEVASNDDEALGVRNSKVVINSEVRTYLIAVDAFSDATQSDFTLEISPTPLNNDDLADAETVTAGVVTIGSNVRADGAQNEFPVASAETNHMVFYEWTAPYPDDDWEIRLDSFDPATDLRVLAYNLDPSRPFPCGDDQLPSTPPGFCYGFSDISLDAGETLLIGIDGATAADLGGFELYISSQNDFDNLGAWRWDLDGRELFFGQPTGRLQVPFTFNNAGATNLSDGELRHGPFLARNTTWAMLPIQETGFYEFKAESLPVAPIDTVMAVYGVDPVWASDPINNPTIPEIENLVLLGVNDDYQGSDNSHVFLELEAGDFIHIMVDGYGGDIGVFDLSFEKIDVPNDSFANAINLESLDEDDEGLPIVDPVKIATSEFGEPPHLGTINQPSAWYYLDYPAGEQDFDGFFVFVDRFLLDTGLLPDDFGVAIYKGDSLATLEPVGGSFGGGATTGIDADLKLTPVEFEAGNRYYLATFGNLDVNWSFDVDDRDPIVEGDDIGDAIVLNGGMASHSSTNVLAGFEDNELAGTCFTDTAVSPVQTTVWYRWQATNDMLVTVDTNASGFDSQLAIYEATPVGLAEVGCSNGTGNGAEVSFTPKAGAYYYFQVDGWLGATGTTSLNVAQAASEPPVSFHLLEDTCTPLSTGPLHAGSDLDGPVIPGWGTGTDDTITFSVVGDIPASQLPFSPARCEVPSTATAIFASFWVVDPSNEGNITLSPAGEEPTGGVLNFGGDGFKNSNGITLPISASGEIDLTLNAGALNGTSEKMVDAFILQVYGWYGPPEAETAGYSEAMEYVPVTPCAFLDTRPNREPSAEFVGPYVGQTTKNPKVAGTFSGQGKLGTAGSLTENTTCGIPEGTSHVMVNTVLVQTTGGPVGMQNLDNFFSFVAFNQPQNVPMNNANAVPMPLDSNGEISFLTTGNANTSTNVRMSVLGYYQPIAEPGGLAFVPLTPCAVFDTRTNQNAVGNFEGARVGGETTRYQVRGNFNPGQGGGNNSCGIPLDAIAVDLSLVAVNAVREGNLVVSAAGAPASGGVLNFAQLTPKMNNANAVTVPLSGAGEIDVLTNAGTFAVGQDTTEIRGVVTGYYIAG